MELNGYEIEQLRTVAVLLAKYGVTPEMLKRASENFEDAYRIVCDTQETQRRRLIQ